MKLFLLPIVQRTAAALEHVENDIRAADLNLIGVTLGAKIQDDAMSHAVKAAVLAELRGRKASLERDLEGYGVTLERAS